MADNNLPPGPDAETVLRTMFILGGIVQDKQKAEQRLQAAEDKYTALVRKLKDSDFVGLVNAVSIELLVRGGKDYAKDIIYTIIGEMNKEKEQADVSTEA